MPPLRPLVAHAVLALLLAATTLAVFTTEARYVAQEPNPLGGLGWAQGIEDWHIAEDGVRNSNGSKGASALVFSVREQVPIASRWITDLEGTSHVRVSLSMRTTDVHQGPMRWQKAGMIARSFRGNGSFLPHWPYEVVLATGTTGWTDYQAVFPVADSDGAMRLVIYHAGAAGTMEARGLSVESVAEAGWFKAARWLIAVLWVLLGGAAVFSVLRADREIYGRLLIVVGALAIASGALMPQPGLTNVFRSLENGLNGLLAQGSALFAERETPHDDDPQEVRREESRDPASRAGERAEREGARQAPRVRSGGGRVVRFSRFSVFDIDPQDLLHVAAFAGLAFLVHFVLLPGHAIVAAVLLLVFAACTEAIQTFTITRTAQVADFLWNALGIVLGTIASAFLGLAVRLGRTVLRPPGSDTLSD